MTFIRALSDFHNDSIALKKMPRADPTPVNSALLSIRVIADVESREAAEAVWMKAAEVMNEFRIHARAVIKAEERFRAAEKTADDAECTRRLEEEWHIKLQAAEYDTRPKIHHFHILLNSTLYCFRRELGMKESRAWFASLRPSTTEKEKAELARRYRES